MRIVRLKAENFRQFESLNLQFFGRLHFFIGDNAAGKTTILESLYCLSRGRSFRASSSAELAGPLKNQWTVFCEAMDAEGVRRTSGVQWNGVGLVTRVDGAPSSVLAQMRFCPMQILEPGVHRVVAEGPAHRRSFIDWGVFHVEHSFIDLWRRYRRALQQRNRLLRLRSSKSEIVVWEPELAETGEALHRLRRNHLDAITPRVNAWIQRLLGEGRWSFELHPGWKQDQTLRDALDQQRPRDLDLGTTGSGPHRAELKIRADQMTARNRISRGQQKLLLAALLLAQCEEIAKAQEVAPAVLLDDFSAELAPRYQLSLAEGLLAYQGQSFVTAFESIPLLAEQAQVFHVEHGKVRF